LYDKVKHLTNCTFYTDGWDAFAKVLPMERHVVGKKHTIGESIITEHTRKTTFTENANGLQWHWQSLSSLLWLSLLSQPCSHAIKKRKKKRGRKKRHGENGLITGAIDESDDTEVFRTQSIQWGIFGGSWEFDWSTP